MRTRSPDEIILLDSIPFREGSYLIIDLGRFSVGKESGEYIEMSYRLPQIDGGSLTNRSAIYAFSISVSIGGCDYA